MNRKSISHSTSLSYHPHARNAGPGGLSNLAYFLFFFLVLCQLRGVVRARYAISVSVLRKARRKHVLGFSSFPPSFYPPCLPDRTRAMHAPTPPSRATNSRTAAPVSGAPAARLHNWLATFSIIKVSKEGITNQDFDLDRISRRPSHFTPSLPSLSLPPVRPFLFIR